MHWKCAAEMTWEEETLAVCVVQDGRGGRARVKQTVTNSREREEREGERESERDGHRKQVGLPGLREEEDADECFYWKVLLLFYCCSNRCNTSDSLLMTVFWPQL